LRSSKQDVVQPGAIAAKGIALLAQLEAIALRKAGNFLKRYPDGINAPEDIPDSCKNFKH
jgi:hypothetical protein